MTDLLDARLRPIVVDTDWLIDDRGLVYKPLETPETFREQQIVSAQLYHNGQPKGEPVFLHADMVFFTDQLTGSQEGNCSLYKSLYKQFVRPRRKAALRERKSQIPRAY